VLDFWVCSSCHSLDRERSSACYKCGGRRWLSICVSNAPMLGAAARNREVQTALEGAR
jgi:hypothetical protein